MHLLPILSGIALFITALLLLLVLFEPPLRYQVKAPQAALDSEDFVRLMSALANAQLHHTQVIEVLSDGKRFYDAEIAAIREAKKSVHIEAFIFHPSAVGDRFREALIERAKNGVEVKLVLDAIGCLPTPNRYFDPLRQAGGQVRWYQPLRFATFKRMNNRTHRELIVIDGTHGFIGGAGIAAHWDTGDKGKPPWRDMMYRVTGGLAQGLQTTFAENWLESSGEILSDITAFPPQDERPENPTDAMVVTSSPTAGRSTRNRIVFQMLIASARKSLCIHSPYFLPDRSASHELVCAASERGVKVKIIVPGASNNHLMTRLASRRRYGPLLKAGVEIYEYQPGMIHTKAMTVDGLWVVVGSTNFDSRSFDLNDEVNLVVVDEKLAAEVEREFNSDLARSEQMTYDKWLHRSLLERFAATVGRISERQE